MLIFPTNNLFLSLVSSADHFTVGRTAGPEHSVALPVHLHPPDSGQSVSTGRNHSKPGPMWVRLELCPMSGGGFISK